MNGQVSGTYNDFREIYDHKKMYTNLKYYLENIPKLEKFRERLNIEEIDSWLKFDLFCYWHNTLRKRKQKEVKSIPKQVDLKSFSKEKAKEFTNLYQTTPNREPISKIVEYSLKNEWVLPYFQRYFEWNRKNVQELLTSIFNDYYIGSFLLWQTERDNIPFETLSIRGVNSKVNERSIDSIVIDGQQRITSLVYALTAPNFALKGSSKPCYFYLNLNAYFKKIQEEETFK